LKPSLSRHSLVLGVALKLTVVTAVVCTLLFYFIFQSLANQGRSDITEAIDTDIAGLVDIYSGQGREGLILRIGERLDVAPTASETPYYRLTDAAGARLAGNLPQMPDINLAASPVFSSRFGVAPQNILVRVTRLRGDLILAVGRSESRLNQGLSRLLLMFGAALTVMVIAAFGIGAYASYRLNQRIAGLNSVFEDMIGPLPTYYTGETPGDEIDYLERHVRDAAARIKGLLGAQRDISDNIAHETRTPLMQLESHLQTAMDQADTPERLAPLQAAKAQTRSLIRLLDALLDIASAEAQRGDLKGLEEISLSEVARSISELYAASAEEAGVQMICEIQDEVSMRADAMQMSRLLVNLLDNAFKYGASGAFIRLSVSQGPIIHVEDDGPGVAEADRVHIFERYRRCAGHNLRGHGLGLPLVKAIAARYGLGIRVEPGERGGARFVVAPEEGR